MSETVQNLLGKAQALRTQAQDMQLKADKAQEYLSQQQTRRASLLQEREQYIATNPSAAGLVIPSVEVPPAQAKEPSGCLFAGSSGNKQSATPPPVNAEAHPRLTYLNTQIADCDNLLGVWKGRLAEYQGMATKLKADADTLEQRAKELQQSTPQPQPNQPVYKSTLRRTDIETPPTGETLDEPFTADAIHVRTSNQQISGNTIRDTILDTAYGQTNNLAEMAHRDAIQLIPANQFAAGELEKLFITGNRIQSAGKLQGIFGSDGIFRNLSITFNTINTQSDHKITLNGLVGQYNHIEGNRDQRGDLVTVQLNPIRLGGNLATGNVWILSVVAADEDLYGYGDINIGGDIASGANPYRHIQDQRSMVQARDKMNGDVNLSSFPMREYKRQLQTMTLGELISRYVGLETEMALWLKRVGELLPGSANLLARVEQARTAAQMQRHVSILELVQHSPDLHNFCIQALAKWMAREAGQA